MSKTPIKSSSTEPLEAASPTKSNFTAALEAARQIQSAERDLLARKAELQSQIEPIEARNLRLWRMPCTKAEILQRVHGNIDAQAARFLQGAKWGEVFKTFSNPSGPRPAVAGVLDLQFGWNSHGAPLNLQDVSHGVRGELGSILGEEDSQQFNTARFCFFCRDLIKAQVDEYFERLLPSMVVPKGFEQESPEMTLEARRAEISENDDRIAALRVEVDEVDRQLSELAVARGIKPAAVTG